MRHCSRFSRVRPKGLSDICDVQLRGKSEKELCRAAASSWQEAATGRFAWFRLTGHGESLLWPRGKEHLRLKFLALGCEGRLVIGSPL